MNRRTKTVAVAAAVLLTLGAGGMAAADDAPAPAAASATVKEAAALTGTAKLYRAWPGTTSPSHSTRTSPRRTGRIR